MIYDRKETYRMAQRLIDGEEDVIPELAIRYDHLAINRAIYIGVPMQREELEDAIAEARYAIMIALSSACGTNQLEEAKYISTYLNQAVNNRLSDFKSKLSIIRIPLTTLRRRKNAGKPINKPKRVSGHVAPTNLNSSKVVHFEYPSLLDDSSLNELEKAIISLKIIDNYSFKKIADYYGKSRYWVKKIYNEAVDKIRKDHGSL